MGGRPRAPVSQSLVHQWSQPRLHPFEPPDIHRVPKKQTKIRGLFEENKIDFTVSLHCKDS